MSDSQIPKVVYVDTMETFMDVLDSISDAPRSARDYVAYARTYVVEHRAYWAAKTSDHREFVISQLDHQLFQLDEIARRLAREETSASARIGVS